MDIYLIIAIFVAAILFFTIAYVVALFFASKNIFANSGSPINMANILLQSILAAGQIIAGLAILAIIVILIITKHISSEVGLPIIAAITGYLVGRSFDSKMVK